MMAKVTVIDALTEGTNCYAVDVWGNMAVDITYPYGEKSFSQLIELREGEVVVCAYCLTGKDETLPSELCCVPRTVVLYLTDRAYGGPEEGGWWYDYSHPEVEIEVDEREVGPLLEIFERMAKERNARRNHNISSVASEGRYEVRLVQGKAPYLPEERPHYE